MDRPTGDLEHQPVGDGEVDGRHQLPEDAHLVGGLVGVGAAQPRGAVGRDALAVDLFQGDLAAPGDLLAARVAYDVVAAPGNVVVYLTPGTEADVVAALAEALRPGGLLVAGFASDRHVGVDEYDGWCRAAGLTTVHLWSTWEGAPLAAGSDYLVGVHRR